MYCMFIIRRDIMGEKEKLEVEIEKDLLSDVLKVSDGKDKSDKIEDILYSGLIQRLNDIGEKYGYELQ